MTDEKDAELRELRERLAKLEHQGLDSPNPSPPPPPPVRRAGCVSYIAAGVLLLLILGALGMCSTDDTSGTSYSSSSSDTAWTPPEGFVKDSTERGVAVKWVRPTASECRGSGVTCFAVEVVAENGCRRSLYAEATLLDSQGRNIGWTNDTAQGVLPGEITRLVFDTYERNVESARIAEINCY